MSEEQRREYIASIESDIGVALKLLKEIEGRPLTRDQAENANRVRAFVQQARESKAIDPTGALQLARRAAILAGDLVRSLER
jgi:hypothetical protein